MSDFVVDWSSEGKLELRGPDRARFLHGMVTNDVSALRPGTGCRASMLTIKGKLLGDLRIYCRPESLLVTCDGGAYAKVKDALDKHLIMDDVEIVAHDALGELGVYGGGARAELARALAADVPELLPFQSATVGTAIVCGARDLGASGYRVFGDARALLDRLGMAPIGEREIEVRRVEAGEPRYGVDMGEDHLPIESRLDETISFTKGCYLGQEVIVRATQQGRINRKLMGLKLDGDGAAQPGAKLAHPTRAEAGAVTSSVVSPRFGAIALAYVHRTVWEPGTELTLHDGDRSRRAVVCDLPFAA